MCVNARSSGEFISEYQLANLRLNGTRVERSRFEAKKRISLSSHADERALNGYKSERKLPSSESSVEYRLVVASNASEVAGLPRKLKRALTRT